MSRHVYSTSVTLHYGLKPFVDILTGLVVASFNKEDTNKYTKYEHSAIIEAVPRCESDILTALRKLWTTLITYFSDACVVRNTVYVARPHDLCECIWPQRAAQGYTNPGHQVHPDDKIVYGHSSRSLSYDKPTASSRARSPESAICCFLFHFYYHFFSLRPSSSCPRLLPRLHVTSILSSICPSTTCFRRQFPSKMWPILLAFLPPWLYVILLHFSHDQYSWYFQSSTTTFQNGPGISDLLSEMFKFQHHTKLCPKCSTSLVSS
jgi:hypothetical protein